MQDDAIKIMFDTIEGWRACELDEGIGLAKAAALRELPYKLDPTRAPYAKKLYWDDGCLNAVITPTRDALTPEWIRYNIEPIVIMVAPASMIDPDEINFVKTTYNKVGTVVDSNTEESTGIVYHHSREEDRVTTHSVIIIFPDRDIQASFSFGASPNAEDKVILAATLNVLGQIANNFLKSPALDILGAAHRASKSSADLAFEYSLTGSFIPDGAEVVYPIKGLDKGWKVYAHNGNDAIMSMFTFQTDDDVPSDFVSRSNHQIFEITEDETGNVGFGWRDEGLQLFLVPPADITNQGVSPLLFTINISNETVVLQVSNDYDVLHDDGDIPGGIAVLAFSPIDTIMFEDSTMYDHSFVGMMQDMNCSINAFYVSSSEESNTLYDEALVKVSHNIAESVRRIAERKLDNS